MSSICATTATTIILTVLPCIGVSAQQPTASAPLISEFSVGEGLQVIHGNQDAVSASSALDWVKQTRRFESEATVNATLVRAGGGWNGTANVNWAGRIGLGQSGERKVYPLTHLWVQRDEASGVNFRATMGGGLGLHLVQRTGVRLTLEGGAGGTSEAVPGRLDNFFTLFGGPAFRWAMNDRVSLNGQTGTYVNGRTGRDLRSNSEIDFNVQVSKRVGLQNQFLIFTDTQPPTGFNSRNLQATVNVSFALAGGPFPEP